MRYDRNMAVFAAVMRLAGAEDEQIQQELHLTPQEMAEFSRRHPEFRTALATVPLLDRVESALLRRALGFRQEESCCEEIVDKKSGERVELLKKRTVSKEVAPDVRALLFWLQNRGSERWNAKDAASEPYQYMVPEDEKEL